MKNEEDKKMEGGEKHDEGGGEEKKQEGEDRQGKEGGEKPAEEGGVVQEDQLVYQSRESQQGF